MTTVGDIEAWLERIAPVRLAESWDNTGLLWGDPRRQVTRVLTCLTVTSAVAAEAIATGRELIVSHHPLPFRPISSVTRSDHRTRILWDLAQAGVSIISRHTAYDNAAGGINDLLAKTLGLTNISALAQATPSQRPRSLKIVVFTPEDCRERVCEAAFAAGAGVINNYSECSFRTSGIGTFLGSEVSNPTVGERGRREEVAELKVEMICPARSAARVIAAVRSAHSYEEPAIDVYGLEEIGLADAHPGVGRLGILSAEMTLTEFASLVANKLDARGVQIVGAGSSVIRKVAIVCGAGDDFVATTAKVGADVLLTGEARFHRALEALELGVSLVLAGHHASERPGVLDLANRLQAEFIRLKVDASTIERDPIQFPDA